MYDGVLEVSGDVAARTAKRRLRVVRVLESVLLAPRRVEEGGVVGSSASFWTWGICVRSGGWSFSYHAVLLPLSFERVDRAGSCDEAIVSWLGGLKASEGGGSFCIGDTGRLPDPKSDVLPEAYSARGRLLCLLALGRSGREGEDEVWMSWKLHVGSEVRW